MAKRRPLKTENLTDLEKKSIRVDDTTLDAYKAVCDETTHEKLDQVIAGVGGGTDTTTVIYNVNIISAGNEVSQALPANTKKFIIRSRNRGQLRLAYTSGGTNTDYLTIPRGSSYEDEEYYVSQTLYFQSTQAGDTVEIVAYT